MWQSISHAYTSGSEENRKAFQCGSASAVCLVARKKGRLFKVVEYQPYTGQFGKKRRSFNVGRVSTMCLAMRKKGRLLNLSQYQPFA